MTTQKQFYEQIERHTQTIERQLNKKRDKILVRIGSLKKSLEKHPFNFASEIDFIEDKIIPYVKRKKFLPLSYSKILRGMRENLTK